MAQEIYRPTGDGAALDWTPYPAAPATHYDKVDEDPANGDTDYVSHVAYVPNGFPTDLYTKPNPGAEIPATDVINFIEVHFNHKSLVGSSSTAGVLYKASWAGAYYGSSFPSATFYTESFSQWALNPDTGLAWTKADLNSLQFGVAKIGATRTSRVTQVFLVVDHNAPPAGKKHLLDGWMAPEA